jgi:transposase InsO family protein
LRNIERLHGDLGDLSPAEFEADYDATTGEVSRVDVQT